MGLITQTRQNQIVQTLKSAEIETAVLDARVLMMHVLDVSIEELLMRRDQEFPVELEQKLDDLVQKRVAGMPIAKIIGMKEFWGLPFKTTMDTLDPRPDSETLIEAVLENLPDRTRPLRILDLGTGTGCLLISLLHEYQNATGVGVDQSEAALAVAQENAQVLGIQTRSNWQVSDWFSTVEGQFDVIISNPPYIPSADIENLAVDVREYDPMNALDGGKDGLEPYRVIANQFSPFLAKNGIIALEYGQGQTNDITAIFEGKTVLIPTVYKDLGGIERCTVFKS